MAGQRSILTSGGSISYFPEGFKFLELPEGAILHFSFVGFAGDVDAVGPATTPCACHAAF